MSVVIPTGVKKILKEKHTKLKSGGVSNREKFKKEINYNDLADNLNKQTLEKFVDNLGDKYISPWKIVDKILYGKEFTKKQKRLARQLYLDIQNEKQMRRV